MTPSYNITPTAIQLVHVKVTQTDGSHATVPFVWLTIATQPKLNLKRLHTMGCHYGVPLNVLGMNNSHLTQWGKCFGWKLKLIQDALEDVGQIPHNAIMMMTDSYDVMLLATAQEIVDRFLAMNTEMVFSAEIFCHPDQHRASEYKLQDGIEHDMHRYKFLNSGTYIGYAKSLRDIMRRFPFSLSDDDQRYWTNVYLNCGKNQSMKLDRSAQIFLCLAGSVNDLQYDELRNQFSSESTGNCPLVLHFNGTRGDMDAQYEKWDNARNATTTITEQMMSIGNQTTLNRRVFWILVIIVAFLYFRRTNNVS